MPCHKLPVSNFVENVMFLGNSKKNLINTNRAQLAVNIPPQYLLQFFPLKCKLSSFLE